MFQTKKQIQALLLSAGISLRKRHGQHFLIDRNLMNRLVESAQLSANDVVLEVGAGTGSLTAMLADRAGAVVTIEIDRTLWALIAEQIRAEMPPKVRLICGDVLAGKNQLNPEVIAALTAEQDRLGGRALMVANLPFEAASPLLIDLVLDHPHIDPLCFTVQKEVAGRILAPPGGRDHGTMSVLIQAMADVTSIAVVPHQAFWPVPEVDAAILRIDASSAKRSAVGNVPDFVAVVKRLFGHRRKTLRHNLRADYGRHVAGAIESTGRIDLNRRPETLSVDEWIYLAQHVASLRPEHDESSRID